MQERHASGTSASRPGHADPGADPEQLIGQPVKITQISSAR
jgi:hypothetical protein